jgi:hypothetical protein
MSRAAFINSQLESEGAAVINTIKVQRELGMQGI